MFTGEEPYRRQFRLSLLASSLVHGVVLLALLAHRPAAIFVRPTSVAQGNGDKSLRVLYFSIASGTGIDAAQRSGLSLNIARKKPRRSQRQRQSGPAPLTANVSQDGDLSDHSTRAGTPFGSLLSGPTEGHDVRPAFPVVFPDPPISRSELPPSVNGDVIIEVTIDAMGNVVETRLLQSVARDIDEKVLTTVQSWRFRPATMDGRPIASKHDVHFHFPS